MPNKEQVKLIQTAAGAVGLRASGHYYLLLAQYKRASGQPVTSCKQLTNSQIDDFLAICESLGWVYPGKTETYCRDKVARYRTRASIAQIEAIKKLAGDLGWNELQLKGMIKRMTDGKCNHIAFLRIWEAYNLIEALKNMLGRISGITYKNLQDVQEHMEVATDGANKKE
jgi:hypothetical protein